MTRKEEQTLADTYGLPEDITSFGKGDMTTANDNETAMNKITKGPQPIEGWMTR